MHLKFPPIKNKPLKQLPEVLIHKVPASFFDDEMVDTFVLFKTKNSSQRSIMKCYPSFVTRDGLEEVDSLYIWKLFSFPRRNGLGTKTLDFAQAYSKKVGCKGNFHLIASVGYMPNEVPHIFYRKYDMNTNDASVNKKMDKFIKKGRNATYLDFGNINMFYPPIKNPKTRFDKLKEFIIRALFAV